MRLSNEICVSFLRASGWMGNHDKELTSKVIDDFKNELNRGFHLCLYDFYAIERIAKLLKEGASNGED